MTEPQGTPQDKPGEVFSWGKFFSGLFNPLNFAKSFVFLVQAAILVILITCVVFTILKVKTIFFKPPKPPAVFTTTGMNGGQVHNSSDDVKKKYGLINLW